jgi:hypothetical protein
MWYHEPRLEQGMQDDIQSTVRAAVAEPILNEYKDALAEY